MRRLLLAWLRVVAYFRVNAYGGVAQLLWWTTLPMTAVERGHWRDWMRASLSLHERMLRRPELWRVLFGLGWVELLVAPLMPLVALVDVARVLYKRRAGLQSLRVRPRDTFSYPEYYLHDFHHQPNGGLSLRSALAYDWQVRFLFAGTERLMRQAVVDALPRGDSLAVLDLGCGTAAWLTQARALGRNHRYTGVDLSPEYLRVARICRRGGTFLQANAEELPAAWDGRFDVVVAIWLFHELPSAAIHRIIREAARVLRPGGKFVFLDAKQRVDHAAYDPRIPANFMDYFAEPYFAGWVELDLEAALRDAGLSLERRKRVHHSVLLTGRKASAG
ncbi:class I SAM-dependent methyltransferase [Sorangium cellulosum]|uniref:class I SAM-dependent methyltransferase n=1 Tax=Sorangium cellulosum TaxID=56 RepID=UPI00133147E0|nr:class I SAM-dependent methyltransferase [Sorangium cellulosum]